MIDQQIQIEEEMYSDSLRRRDNDNRKTTKRDAWSESKIGSQYTKTATSRFSKTIYQKLENYTTERVGSNQRAIKLLVESGLEPEVVSHLFCKSLYNAMPLVHRRRLKRVSLCMKAAECLHDEVRIRHFGKQENRRNLLKKLFKDFDKKTYPREWRKRTIRNYFHAEQLSWEIWSTKQKLLIGYTLMVWFRDATGLIKAPRNSMYVDPTDELLDHVDATMTSRVLDFMLYKPMVVKPIPWSNDNLFKGGYLSSNVRPYPIIKGARKRDLERMQSMDWSKIIPAINALQETPWRVNKTVLDALEWTMLDRGGDVAGLPSVNPKPLPPAPVGYREDEAITKAHNELCFRIHSANREIISKRLLVLSTIAVARQFKNYKSIYFPHNFDSRGRAYPLPVFLQPQGPSWAKALLEFSEGKPIETEEQACWLAVAGANAYGNDKVSLQDRVDWVQDNQDDLIFPIAEDWKTDLRWMDCDSPFEFLRFCLEWKAFWDTGLGFVSHMVCAVDATCSGLQNYSAALRDSVGGRSVNLIPGLPRQDIYQDVADRVIEKMMQDGTPMARDWLAFGIDRKTTKRQTMVLPYAATFSSCLEYTRDWMNEKIADGHPKTWAVNLENEHDERDRVVYLSKLIWSAIDEIVVKGKEAMKWLSDATREYSKWVNKRHDASAYDKHMSWVTPDGFHVIHYKPDLKKSRLATFLDGRVDLVIHEQGNRLDTSQMALAVAPNWIHSLDATLLRASVLASLENGVTASFAMVHDSFGVHAACMSQFLNGCVKPAFVDMYTRHDVLQEFADRLPPDVNVGALPKKGDLDLQGVLESEFFFS